MKKLIFISFLFYPLFVLSQNWYPIGATWHYNYQEQLTYPAHGYTKYTVIKDTVVDTKPSKLIEVNRIRYNGLTLSVDSLIVREENSKAYYYYNNTFQLMYDFTLDVDDTLAININGYACDSVSPLIVDSIKELNINGNNLKVQYVRGIYYYKKEWGGQIDTITYTIIEKVGNDLYCCSNINFLFNPVCQTGDEFVWSGLRCYNDSNISYSGSYWDVHFPNYPCDTLIDEKTEIYEAFLKSQNINIYPNPADELIFIDLYNVSGKTEIVISDIAGRNVLRTASMQHNKSNIQIDIRRFRAGIYFIRVIGRETTAGSKFIIAR